MTIDRVAAKERAKGFVRTGKPSPVLTALLFVAILYVLGVLRTQLTGSMDVNELRSIAQSGDIEAYMDAAMRYVPGPGASIIIALLEIMSMMISVGFTIFCMQIVRSRPAAVGNLFDGFGIFFRVFALEFMIWLFVALWSMLLIVPGIIASYRYRQALYILLDHPEKGIMQCIRESKDMMRGHKWELFCWDLSFLGWYLLCVIPFVSVWVEPYSGMTYVLYYDALRGADIPAQDNGETSEYRGPEF